MEETISLLDVSEYLSELSGRLEKGFKYLYDQQYIKSFLELKEARNILADLGNKVHRACIVNDEQGKRAEKIKSFISEV